MPSFSLLKLNRYLDSLIPLTTPLAVILGLFFPRCFSTLRPYVLLLFGIMTFSGALKLTARELLAAVRNPAPIFIFFLSFHVLMPLAALFSSSVIFTGNPDIITGFVLLFAGPTAVSGFIWVMIYKGDKALGLTLILLDTILAPLVVPLTLSVLIGAKTAMDMTGIAVSLLFMVVIPTIIGVTINETSKGKIPEKICPGLDPFAKICLMLVIAANSSAVAPIIKFSDPLVWRSAALCITLTSSGFLIAWFTGFIGKYGGEKKASLIIAGGLRNNSAVMTIAVAFFPETTVLPALLSIIFQQIITAVMGKLIIGKQTRNSEQNHPE